MSSFSCPHLDLARDHCTRLCSGCVPGRRGCVLHGRAQFVWPAEDRVREREEQRAVLGAAFQALTGHAAQAVSWE